MSDDTSFLALMARLRSGDDAAAARIFQKFAHRLVGLARQRLPQDVKAKVDPEDVLQSVMRTFFIRHGAGQFQMSGWHDLWNLLAAITVRKCGGKIDYYRAVRRDAKREATPWSAADSAADWEPIAREPTPSEVLMLVEVMEDVVRGLGERDRHILELTLQGEAAQRISEQLACSERTVERVLERIRKNLERANETK